MLVKIRTAHGPETFQWIDGVDEVQTFGIVFDAPPKPDGAQNGEPTWQGENAPPPLGHTFFTWSDAVSAVEGVWGDQREFDREVWPSIPLASVPAQNSDEGVLLTTMTVRRGVEHWLIVLAGEAFLLSETGGTIDRLR